MNGNYVFFRLSTARIAVKRQRPLQIFQCMFDFTETLNSIEFFRLGISVPDHVSIMYAYATVEKQYN